MLQTNFDKAIRLGTRRVGIKDQCTATKFTLTHSYRQGQSFTSESGPGHNFEILKENIKTRCSVPILVLP